MSKREEVLDMAVHSLAPLMRKHQNAKAEDLFDEALKIGKKLFAKVEDAANIAGAPPRDELMDMGVHALSALLSGRQPDSVEGVLDECIDVAQALIRKVESTLGAGADEDQREELMDMTVHVQTAVLSSRPKMDADALADQCVNLAKNMIALVDEEAV